MVKLAFFSSKVPCGLNHTLITLVPKVPCPRNMTLFKFISLCCTLYIVISKVIVARIRPLLQKLIRPSQVCFVLGPHF